MRDVEIANGEKILILEDRDVNLRSGSVDNLVRVKEYFEIGALDLHDVIVVLISTKQGKKALPRWLRDLPLRPTVGAFGHSYWIMEKDLDGEWIK